LTAGKFIEFGGATTCVLLNLGPTHIMVDCGSGISNALEDLQGIDELHLFISHNHLDHICGIPTLLGAMENKKIHIWGKTFGGIGVREAIGRMMNQSYWPVCVNVYQNVTFHEITGDVTVGDVTVKNTDSNHPGGCSLFRFECASDVVVTAFDFCHLDRFEETLCDFAKGCTTLIYDGNMTEDELIAKPDWGHSTPEAGARIGTKIGAKKVYITHFGAYDDNTLTEWERRIRTQYPNVTFARSGQRKDDLLKLVDIGNKLNVERDLSALVLDIVQAGMDITSADGGTLYLLQDGKLEFNVLVNRSKKTCLVKRNTPLGIPAVDINAKNICAAAAREKKVINVPDCRANAEYDFSGVLKYDQMNEYTTKSVLVIPFTDEYDDVVGVLQLINSTDVSGEIVPFRQQDEKILMALANQAGMAINNALYSAQITELLYGFVKVMSVGIDERTPYNANHTRNMVHFADRFFDYEEKVRGPYAVNDVKRREILMGIWLHDVGKILIPLEIMNKDSRLGEMIGQVENRFARRALLLKLQRAEGKMSDDEYETAEAERVAEWEFIQKLNRAGFLADDLKAQLDALAAKTYVEEDGAVCPVLTSEEYHELSIVKGTLTSEERSVMEGHVTMTQKFLSQLKFPKYYDSIPTYAGNHHEFLNGTGYPQRLGEQDLPWPCRLITVCDIFEALIAKDRPYKKPFPIDKAFDILNEMAGQGKLDRDVIAEFAQSNAWAEPETT